MPNRVLRDWTASEKIDVIDVYAERFFTRLIMKVDDFGRYSANPKLIKSTLFPLKSDIRETDISRWLTECERSGLIALYSVAERGYLQINDFRQVLRQKNEKYPPPSNDTHPLSTCIADVCLKGNETENEVKGTPPPLLGSNLFRQPNIPLIEDVIRVFKQSGGTEEMANKFFYTNQGTGWFHKGSPITNFANFVPYFISSWKQYETKSTGVDPNLSEQDRKFLKAM